MTFTKTDWFINGEYAIKHAQKIIGNSVTRSFLLSNSGNSRTGTVEYGTLKLRILSRYLWKKTYKSFITIFTHYLVIK
jgi:hypothetical protein